MSASGTTRTFSRLLIKSAFGCKADIGCAPDEPSTSRSQPLPEAYPQRNVYSMMRYGEMPK